MFYLLLQIKIRYHKVEREEEKKVGQRPSIKTVQADCNCVRKL